MITSTSLSPIIKELVGGLSTRQKDVLSKRFCLANSAKEGFTLAKLGEEYSVTRERIRQIEASALFEVQKKISTSPRTKAILTEVHKYIDREDGALRETMILAALKNDLGVSLQSPQLHFLLESEGKLAFYPEDKDFYAFWHKDIASQVRAIEVIKKTHQFFRERRGELIREGVKVYTQLSLNEKANLALSKKFGINIYGDYGLTEWPEINPKTIRDRAYLILKKISKPAHFRDITKLIGERKFDAKPVFASTVHNELIKDRRFVLVGRGVYGLTEQGYRPGTTREVITEILKSKGPLPASVVVKLVGGERQFKESTILLNLQNRKYFERLEDSKYRVNEA